MSEILWTIYCCKIPKTTNIYKNTGGFYTQTVLLENIIRLYNNAYHLEE